MNRRELLGSVGAVVSGATLASMLEKRDDPLTVRVWFSDRAAEYDDLRSRVRGYLTAALEPAVGDARVEFADGPVSLPSEGGAAVLSRYWPRLVLEGAALGDVNPVGGVNLLVTDGDPTEQPSGFAYPHIAAATGAKQLAKLPPADEMPVVAPYTLPTASAQLLLHECGHAIGLKHDHGSAVVTGETVVASPMVSSYIWAPAPVREKQLSDDGNACGQSYPDDPPMIGRRLRLRYAACARRALGR